MERKFIIEGGGSNIILSAPHACNHKRNNNLKVRDFNTGEIVKKIKEITDCHIIYVSEDIDFDPNYDLKNVYKMELENYIKENDIQFLIDIHGMKFNKNVDIDLGTRNYKNLNGDVNLFNNIFEIFNKNFKKVKRDYKFKASKRTISHYVNNKLRIPTLQIEIGENFRNNEVIDDNSNPIINTLCEVVNYLSVVTLNKLDYISRYDKVLDIKSLYKYKRQLSKVLYTSIGLEIEVAVNYDRKSFSFIKKMLEKIKKIVGENGYFVKDGTILGDYSFEIILDPLPTSEIYNIYFKLKEVIDFSSGLIEISSNKNCGIHANFNKFDVSDLNVAHKNIINIVLNHKKYFTSNIYKQINFINDYNEYYNYQEEIADKYLWANYLKSKIIEIRNISPEISATELKFILDKLLMGLYFDKMSSFENEKLNINDLFKLIRCNYDKLIDEKNIRIEIVDDRFCIK